MLLYCCIYILRGHFFLLLYSIPLNGYTTLCLSVHLLLDICIVSSFLTVANKAGINIHLQVFVWTYASIFFGKHLGVQYLGLMVGICSCLPMNTWLFCLWISLFWDQVLYTQKNNMSSRLPPCISPPPILFDTRGNPMQKASLSPTAQAS